MRQDYRIRVAISAMFVLSMVVATAVSPARPAVAGPGFTELGTLGGVSSAALAVDEALIVGWSETATGDRHAFAYDTSHPSPTMRDLGTLGGPSSRAVAVSGTVVVGEAQTHDGRTHAFAVDLSDENPQMVDLGSLGGSDSAAVAVDGDLVVGWSDGASGEGRRAFAVDLGRPDPLMTELGEGEAVDVSGNLIAVRHEFSGYLVRFGFTPERIDLVVPNDSGMSGAVPADVDGALVVGWSWIEAPENRAAFVYDANHPEHGVRSDIFDQRPARAVGVSGGVIAGEASSSPARALGRDIRDAQAPPYDLGPGVPAAVSGSVIVGAATGNPFAADLSAPTPSQMLLPTGGRGGAAHDIDGTAVVGVVSHGDGSTRAASWTLYSASVLAARSASSVVAGDTLTVRGILTTTGSTDGLSDQTLQLLTRPAGTTTWERAGDAVTGATGVATFTLKPTRNIQLHVTYAGSAVATPAASDVRDVIVNPAVTARLSDARIRPGTGTRLSGRATPVVPGQRIRLQKFTTTGWSDVRSTTAASDGTFRFWLKPPNGWHSFRAFADEAGGRSFGFSRLQALRVFEPVPLSPELAARPNVVVILTDDQRPEMMSRMRAVQSLLVRKGVRFTQAMVPTALCCPSRATVLTGRYSHNTGVYSNGGVEGPTVGGWYGFHRSGAETSTLPVALAARGYRTALVGKYLNYFGKYAPRRYSPPGWDRFVAIMSNHGGYYHYRLSTGELYGSDPEDYSTDVYAHEAEKFIRGTQSGRPLFLYFTPYGPHLPYTPAPRHLGAWEGKLPVYAPPSVNADLAGKPAYLQGLPEISAEDIDRIRTRQQESLMSVDEAVARLVRALRDTGRLHNTLVVFASDNGYLWGDHRLWGKDKPYTPALKIPMVLRWDAGIKPGQTDNRFALNVDIANTIAKATGTPYSSDGLNLVGPYRRNGFLLEAAQGYHRRPAYCGWRDAAWMFVQYASGERELYDLGADPFELHNVADDPAYAEQLEVQRQRAMKACTPTPPGFSW